MIFIARRFVLGAALVLAALAGCGSANAQTYPTKPITVIIPFAGGSASDVVSRIMLDKMSNARWTKIYDLAPMVQAPGEAAQAAPNPLGELRAVNVHLLRIEMPPEKAGGTPGALVLSANFTKTSDQQWDATVQAGQQLADAEPTLAPPIHIQFKSEDAHLLARSPEANTDFAGATALDR